MAIDPRKNLILLKGEDKTADVKEISRDAKWVKVTFDGGRSYRYRQENVRWLMDPKPLPSEHQRVELAGDLLSDVHDILVFDQWVKIFHIKGDTRWGKISDLTLRPETDKDDRSTNLLSYFKELAKDAPLRAEDGTSYLS